MEPRTQFLLELTNDSKQGSNQSQRGIQGVAEVKRGLQSSWLPKVCFNNTVFPLQFKSGVSLEEGSILSLLYW